MPTPTIDPIAQRGADLINAATEKYGTGKGSFTAQIFSENNATFTALALRDFVQSVSDAVRAWEESIRYETPYNETGKALLAFKVPNAMDLMKEAFIAAVTAPPGIDRWATFRDEAMLRNLGTFIHDTSAKIDPTP